MKSSMCKAAEHDYCGKVLKQADGKHFRCDCECHPKEVKKIEVEDDSDEDS